jgi:branched-chain amino acid transport system permease protein
VIDYTLQQIINALSAGSLYALMAVGLAMVFGILRLINFAHGDLMMISAYIAVFSLGAGLSLAAALPVIVLGTVIVGLLMERVAYRPIRGAPDVAMLLSSFAVGQILQNGTLLVTRLAGKPTLIAFPSPDILNGVVKIGTLTIPKVNVASFFAGVILLGLLSLFVTRTTLACRCERRPRTCPRPGSWGSRSTAWSRRPSRSGPVWLRSRGSCMRSRPGRSTHTWASRRCSRRSSQR